MVNDVNKRKHTQKNKELKCLICSLRAISILFPSTLKAIVWEAASIKKIFPKDLQSPLKIFFLGKRKFLKMYPNVSQIYPAQTLR